MNTASSGTPSGAGLSFFRSSTALVTMPFFGAFLGRQVEQHHRHAHVDQVGGDLRAHHAGAEHGDLPTLNRLRCMLDFPCSFDAQPGLSAAEHRLPM